MSDANERRWSAALAALDANMLVALDALLREANVTRAATRLGVSQSAMSQTLGRLRRQFDDPILVKVGRHMELSPFSCRIRGRLHGAITALEAVVRDRPSFDPAVASRRFVIAAVDYLALLLVPALRAQLATEAPGVTLAVHAPEAGSIADRLADGTIDLYVGVHGATERALQTQSLHAETLALLVRADHDLVADPSTSTYAAAQHIHVSPRRESGSLVQRALRAEGYDHAVAVEVPFFALVPELLRGSDLVATIPRRIAEHFARDGELCVRPVPLDMPSFEVCQAWHPSFGTDPGLVWLREAVARALP